MKKIFLSAVIGASLILSGCGESNKSLDANSSESTISVVTTTGMIADTVQRVGGERVGITSLVGAGVDPHLFKPTFEHIKAMQSADIIFYNGIELEARMGDALVSLARDGKKTFPVTEDIERNKLREPSEFEGKYDPHFWHSVPLWIESVEKVEKELSQHDPQNKNIYKKNAEQYIAELKELDEKLLAKIQNIPQKSRVLITAHDAFGYFGERYGVEVKGVVGISTEDEAHSKGINDLANLIAKREVKAIFVENTNSGDGIRALQAAVAAKGGKVKIGGELLADSLSAAGEKGDSYISMMEHNMNTIVNALQ